MRSLGQLSAGMIHEINNPLNFAATGIYTLRNQAKHLSEPQRPEYLDTLSDVEEGVKRVKDLVSKMREFSHSGGGEAECVDVADIVESALRFLSHEWRGKVDVQRQIPAGQTIWANKNRTVQVVLNLVQNSLDSVTKKNFQDETPAVQIVGRLEGGQSFLSIRDNGGGINPEHLDKIFDPFFTTKDVGEGMGLGLSICYRIVQDCGGRICVKSDPGKSCEFTLEFSADQPVVST